jgi:hypothetical protein
MPSDAYDAQRYVCLGCDREWTWRESNPIEIVGFLFHNDECWVPAARDGATPGLT